ncbi:hypothetical protein GZH47_32325 (plasmid) [Paenibacillus rhizovicinus]|uniref:JAB domain-containing protein n=1 Tax=Paenibacillus rhizovicinus TaxID=2704463 RepID=A0A6C0PCF9_9BACL|nr:hypothetical protein [Paenibacillus rhizovicinus]QHW35573.1 hypothetical protein GZH47_32325 [Paenibacillus rhizovicinus]
MSKDNGPDLFSYFGGIDLFSSSSKPEQEESQQQPASPAPSEQPAADQTQAAATNQAISEGNNSEEGNKIVNLAAKRLKEQRRGRAGDACEDRCEDEPADREDEEEEESAEDEELDEGAADRAELAGGSGNAEVGTDNKAAGSGGPVKKEEKKPEFNLATFIAYAGHTLSLTKFFSAEQLADLDLEAVRKRLEKDFPELSKQRTKMDWDEKKNLICPMVTGGKKGSFFSQGLKGFFFRSKDLFAHKEPINILAARDGYYEVRENPIGVFVSKTNVVEELEPCREGFKMSLPKIPEFLFAQLVNLFYDYACFDVEVMGVFYWDTENERYFLDVPQQSVSKFRVDACYTEFPPHIIKVAEIHSHNTMSAYFSDIDDTDELGTMLYGVVGRLQKGTYQVFYDLKIRAGVAGRFISLSPETVLEGAYPEGETKRMDPVRYPLSWPGRVHMTHWKLRDSMEGNSHD